MGKEFCALFKKDFRMLVSGKFFLTATGFLVLYTAYVNLGYIRFLQMPPYNVYLYDPAGTQTQKSSLIQTVTSMEEMDTALLADANGVGLDAGNGEVQVILYAGAEHVDRHRADYALSLLRPSASHTPEMLGTNTPEQKARKEITCELLFFELAAVRFLGIAALLLKDFRQFTLAYLVIAIFAATPVFLSANTSVKFDWIGWHPFYHAYMGLKSACFGTTISPVYYADAVVVILLLFLAVRCAFHRELEKEG